MTSLLSARKRAEEFAAAVDAGPATGVLRPELAELVTVVHRLRAEAPVAPRADFTSSLRERLMAEAPEALAQEAAPSAPARRAGAWERRLVAAAASFALVGGSAGMAMAADGAMPGDALYPIKRGLESAEVVLSTNAADKGRELLDQAGTRLVEVGVLLEDPDSLTSATHVPKTMVTYREQAHEGSVLLLESYDEEQDPALVREVHDFAAEGIATLERLAEDAPDGQLGALGQAATTLAGIDQTVVAACTPCELGPAVEVPSTLEIPDEPGGTLAQEVDDLDDDVIATGGAGGSVGETDTGSDPGSVDQGTDQGGEGAGDGGPTEPGAVVDDAPPTTDPTTGPTPEPTPDAAPPPTPTPTPEPSQEPTPEPTQEPTPAPSQEPTPGPTPDSTPTATPAPPPEPTTDPSGGGGDSSSGPLMEQVGPLDPLLP